MSNPAVRTWRVIVCVHTYLLSLLVIYSCDGYCAKINNLGCCIYHFASVRIFVRVLGDNLLREFVFIWVTVCVHMYLLVHFPLSLLLGGFLCVCMRMCWLVYVL